MTNLKLILPVFLLLNVTYLFSQESNNFEINKKRKQFETQFTNQAPKIDGVFDDIAWEKALTGNKFLQTEPFNDRFAGQQTQFKILYDNTALYVAITLFDSKPDSIFTLLTQRDEVGQADFAGIILDSYNNNLTAFGFFVSAAGVQMDIKYSGNREDNSWDAVWESAVRITEYGWTIELKIPYSALRFPKLDIQKPWAVNFFRKIGRTREESTWSYVDVKKETWLTQMGHLNGIKNVKPPLRLSFMPYFSSYVNTQSNVNRINYSFKGGMDLKYGINESYTLDMMLIPDFGQVQSDDEILNLSPFETYYSEKRSFFTEGMELFNKAGIFHSRRIGGYPTGEVQLNEHEEIKEMPENAQLLNATKITGTNSNGLSVGALNAMTLNTYATVVDTITHAERESLVQAFTNYNVLVFNKALENNSYASIINTNLVRFEDNYSANVIGFETQLKNKNQNYAINASGAFNNVKNADNQPDFGYYYDIEFEKISGKYQFEISHFVESHNYNPNDMGFLRNPNEVSYSLELNYIEEEPGKNILSWYTGIDASVRMLYFPRVYTGFGISNYFRLTFKNHFTLGGSTYIEPFETHDYFEARVENRVYKRPEVGYMNLWISSNYSKKFAVDVRSSGLVNSQGGFEIGALISPRAQLNDKWNLRYSFNYYKDFNNKGFVDYTDNEDTVYFGNRDLQTITNTFNMAYTPTNRMGFTFRLRHYWRVVDYDSFYILNEDGYLDDFTKYTNNEDISFNSFTIDFVYKWNFAPGSELSLVWKNQVNNNNETIIYNYFDNTDNLFANSPANNSFSIKILYYLDYLYLKKKG